MGDLGDLEPSCFVLRLMSLQDRRLLLRLLLSIDQTRYKEDCRSGESDDLVYTECILRSPSRRHGGGNNAADELETRQGESVEESRDGGL